MSGKSPLVVDANPVPPSFVRRDDRGLFVEVVNEGPWETVIHGSMKAGKAMGDHYHRENKAFFFLTSGSAEVKIRHLIDDSQQRLVLKAGEGIYFLPFEVHTITYLEDADFLLLKSYRYQADKPDIFPEQIDK